MRVDWCHPALDAGSSIVQVIQFDIDWTPAQGRGDSRHAEVSC